MGFFPNSGNQGVAGNLTVTGAVAAATVTATPGPITSGGTILQTKQATTPNAGAALINGTQTLATWTTPNDGAPHNFRVSAIQTVTVAETGGVVQVAFTDSRGTAATSVLFPGGSGTGDLGASLERLAAPNTSVAVNQSTALTAGAAVVDAQIWGS